MELNYEDYAKKLAEIEEKAAEAKAEKEALNKEYQEVIDSHKKDLEEAFKVEQDNYGKTLEGKYYHYVRDFEEDKDFTIEALFKLDAYRKYIGQPNHTPVIYQMEGMEVFVARRNGKIVQFNSHKCDGAEINETVNFAISNTEHDCTTEITKDEFESKMKETMKEYYGA